MSCTSLTASDKEILCTLTGAEKRYARRSAPALGPLSLAVEAGEVLGIRGPNGAGKSTLLGLLAGVLRPDRGEIVWGEGVRGRIGYVPQELSLYSGLTGLENLRFWAKACGLPGRAVPARSRWLLERLERRVEEKKDLVLRYQFWGLLLLVAVPLPGTGAWTGAMVAAVMDLRMKRSMPAIFAGVLIAAAIVTAITMGLFAL